MAVWKATEGLTNKAITHFCLIIFEKQKNKSGLPIIVRAVV